MWNPEQLAYCSNLHAGESIDEVQGNLAKYVAKVREKLHLKQQSSGLWLSAKAADALSHAQAMNEFKACLSHCGIQLTSLNGFPYGNFHNDVVKQAVYQPDWSTPERLLYTQNLAQILAQCLQNEDATANENAPHASAIGTISTLPLGYKSDFSPQKRQRAQQQLLQLNQYLGELHARTNKRIVVCLEMEPDCELARTDELIAFFQTLTQRNGGPLNYLGACFDVCHQAVMYEDIYDSLRRIHQAGILIGKIQVSNAIHIDVAATPPETLDSLHKVLIDFAEPKFLHQVTARRHNNSLFSAPDLSVFLQEQALNPHEIKDLRVHFHVPLNAEHFIHPAITPLHAPLQAMFQYLADCHAMPLHVTPFLEVETYSWDALPSALQPQSDEALIQGVANEITWLAQQLKQRGLS